MTAFVVSLFLPYTVEFDTTPASRLSSWPITPPTPPPPFPLVRNASTASLKALSLFQKQQPVGPPTPAAADTEAFFSSLGGASVPALTLNRPATPGPGTLVRTESLVPDWGQARILNQPRSRPTTAPPVTILQYAKSQELHAAKAIEKLKSPTPLRPSRRNSHERTYSDHAWDIVPAIQGNNALSSVMKTAMRKGFQEHVSWVGTLGFPTDTVPKPRKNEIEEKLECEHDAMTVFVDDNDLDGHYNHYCKTILWPIMHYQVPDHPRSKAYADHSWAYYVKVNQAFADRVVRSYKHGDTIWIHDYHLLLLPSMIRKKLPDAKIGFFLHTAFPSSEVFRCLAMRRELLEGILGANLVVFQGHEYAHHFLTTCGRILVVEATDHGVQLEDHFVNVTSVPMGIIPAMVLSAREDNEVNDWVKVLMAKYKEKRLIVARDKLDSTRGVKQKLLAYEMFLKNNPEWKEKVVLIQVAMSSNVDRDLDSQIADIVTRIDARYSTLAHQPLVLLKQDISNSQYLALLTVADVLMVTPLRDGMNLTSHEYVICQDGKGSLDLPARKKHGPLILSEFTGSARVFKGAELSINPWDYAQCARTIKTALEMPEEEKDSRYEAMLAAVLQTNGERWVQEIESRLNTAYRSQQQRDTMSVPRLSVNILSERYKQCATRLFILDYEGTLATWEAAKRTPLGNTQRVIDTIINLISASDSNIVYIASSRTTKELEHLFRAVPNAGLIAENGCFLRPFTTKFQPEEWLDLADSANSMSWKKGIVSMLNFYVERIEGTWVEERTCSVFFSYADVKEEEMDSAARQAGDFANHINDSCSHLRVRAVPVDRGVVVELSDHSKMTASCRLLEIEKDRLNGMRRKKSSIDASIEEVRYANGLTVPNANGNMPNYAESTMAFADRSKPNDQSRASSSDSSIQPDSAISMLGYFSQKHEHHSSRGHSVPQSPRVVPRSPRNGPDFLMVAGDNREDEPMFHWANQLAQEGCVKNVFSVFVGKNRSTEARFTLNQGVTGLLTALQKLSML